MQFLLASSTQRTGEFAKVDISLSMCTQKGVHQARHKWVLAVKERKESFNENNNVIHNKRSNEINNEINNAINNN